MERVGALPGPSGVYTRHRGAGPRPPEPPGRRLTRADRRPCQARSRRHGQERLLPSGRLDRSAAPPVLNGNDEYTLEAALQFVDANGGDVTLVAMGPPGSQDALRKGLAMGAARAVLVTDDALEGSCALSTMTGAGRRAPPPRGRPGARRRGQRRRGRRRGGGRDRHAPGPPARVGRSRDQRGRRGRRSRPASGGRGRGDGGGRAPRARGRDPAPRRAAVPVPARGSWAPGPRRSRSGRSPTSASTAGGSAGQPPRRSSSPSSRPRPAPPPAWSVRRRTSPRREIVELLVERRAI